MPITGNQKLPFTMEPFTLGPVEFRDMRSVNDDLRRSMKRKAAEVLTKYGVNFGHPALMLCNEESQLTRHGFSLAAVEAYEADPAGFDYQAFKAAWDPVLGDWEMHPDKFGLHLAIGNSGNVIGALSFWNMTQDNSGAVRLIETMGLPLVKEGPADTGKRGVTMAKFIAGFLLNNVEMAGKPARIVKWHFPVDSPSRRWKDQSTQMNHLIEHLKPLFVVTMATQMVLDDEGNDTGVADYEYMVSVRLTAAQFQAIAP